MRCDSTKVRLATLIRCNGSATCGMPVNSGEIFISFPLGKCASWIICHNALHHLKRLEISFHRMFLSFFYHDPNLVFSLSKLNVIIFVNIHPILILKKIH